MTRWCGGLSAAATAVLLLTSATIFGQGAGTKPSTRYAPPRTADGKADLQGIWQAVNSAAWDIQDHSSTFDTPAGFAVVEGNEIPYQPWAAAKQKENFERRDTLDPLAKCYLPGVPRITYMPFPFQIVQTPNHVAILYEYTHATRTIYTDGSPHAAGTLEFWMGDSRGRWEGDTLVVDVRHFNDKTWFDKAGNFHSDALHIVERYTRTGPDHLTYHVTVEDPKVFTKPWTMTMPLYRRMEERLQLLDYECVDHVQELQTGQKVEPPTPPSRSP